MASEMMGLRMGALPDSYRVPVTKNNDVGSRGKGGGGWCRGRNSTEGDESSTNYIGTFVLLVGFEI